MDKFVDFCSSVFTNLSSLKNGTNDIESYLMKEDPSLYKKIGTFQINYDTFLLDLKNYSHKLQTESKELINNLSDDLTALDLLNVTNLIDDNVKPYIERAEALQLDAKDIAFLIKDIAQKLEQQEKDEEVPDDAPWWVKAWTFVKNGFNKIVRAVKKLAEMAWGSFLNPYLEKFGLGSKSQFADVIAKLGDVISDLNDLQKSFENIGEQMREIKASLKEEQGLSDQMKSKLRQINTQLDLMSDKQKNSARTTILNLLNETLASAQKLEVTVSTNYLQGKSFNK